MNNGAKQKKSPNPILANHVRVLRKSNNMTQAQLAEKLHFTAKYIADMENARRSITPQTADLMANLFHVDSNYFLDATNEEEQENRLIFNAICSLATLNGYKVEMQDLHGKGEGRIEDYFLRMRDFMIFYRDGKKAFSLSVQDANRFGNLLSDIFTSHIEWKKQK